MPEYMVIGRGFKAGKTRWVGKVVASRGALFMLQEQTQTTAAVAGQFGLLGILVAKSLSVGRKPDPLRACTLADLPEEVRSHADWPLKKKKKGDVVIVPRARASVLKKGRWLGGLKFEADGVPFEVSCLPFRGKKVKAFLEQCAWPMEW